MEGYIRRKVTRNLGKGGISLSSGGISDGGSQHRDNLSINPFTWLNDISNEPKPKFFILDGSQKFSIDREYRDRGISEEWLRLHSCVEDGEGNIKFYYLYTGPV